MLKCCRASAITPLLLVAAALLANGCATVALESVDARDSAAYTEIETPDASPGKPMTGKAPGEPMMSPTMMDKTIGSYGEGREQRLILVTLVDNQHAALIDSTGMEKSADEQLPPRYTRFLQGLRSRFGVERVAEWPLPAIGIHCLVLETDGQQPREAIVAALNTVDQVETAQAVQMFSVRQDGPQKRTRPYQQNADYNDPYLPLQHGIKTVGAEYSHRWARGEGVTVAVIDTGVDTAHAELEASVKAIKNFVDEDEAAFRSDIHGTAVAGVIAAAADNHTGMVGVAPGAKLLALKACWQEADTSEDASCNSYTLAKALHFAIANEVDIINLSLDGPRDPLLERLVQKALDKQMIVVGARSPDGVERFPVVVKGTVAVGQLMPSSGDSGVTAPGVNVLSTRPSQAYEFYTGSSFSTAHVAGVAALVRELQPGWTGDDLQSLMHATSDHATGSANACKAIAFMTQSDDGVCMN